MEENQDLSGNVKRLVSVLRDITLAVQIVPFACGAIYIAVYVSYLFASDYLMTVLDTFFYISPLFCVAHLIYSKMLRLCEWHRAACVVPIFPQVVNLVDYYLISLSEVQAMVFTMTAVAMTVTLLVAAYNVFFK